ncbi:MAG: hypothetical protein Kow00103_08360 [Candidatus Caldatribacteriota bacterium]
MKRKVLSIILIVAVTLVVLGISLIAEAQNVYPPLSKKFTPDYNFKGRELMKKGWEEDRENGIRQLIKSLNLSEEQQKEIEKILFNFQKENIELQSKIKILNLEIKEISLQPQAKLEDVQEMLKEVANLEAELKGKRLEVYFKIRDLLTPEQKSKLPLNLPFLPFQPQRMGMFKVMNRNCW